MTVCVRHSWCRRQLLDRYHLFWPLVILWWAFEVAAVLVLFVWLQIVHVRLG